MIRAVAAHSGLRSAILIKQSLSCTYTVWQSITWIVYKVLAVYNVELVAPARYLGYGQCLVLHVAGWPMLSSDDVAV